MLRMLVATASMVPSLAELSTLVRPEQTEIPEVRLLSLINGHIDVPFNAALNPASYTVTLWANASSTNGFASPITSRDDTPRIASTATFYIMITGANGTTGLAVVADQDHGTNSQVALSPPIHGLTLP
jgi:hypothetical protein